MNRPISTYVSLALRYLTGASLLIAFAWIVKSPAGAQMVTEPTATPTFVNSPDERVNINTASLQELMSLPTIGQAIGSRIIEYRKRHGRFKHPSDVIIIRGISERKFRQIEDLITTD